MRITTTTRHPAAPARRGPRRERGSVSVEAAILAPALAALIVLAVVVGRSSIAYNAVAAAAHDAARAASISRTEDIATAQATVVAQSLDDVDCAETNIIVNASQLHLPVGEPAMVDVTVVCVLDFSDVGLPLTRTLEATFHSPVDVWRGRGGPS